MMKRLAAIALLMTLPVAASAQTSRVEGMALQGDYIKDYTGIFTYTSSVSGVGNLIYGELGRTGPSQRAVGAVLGNLFDGNLGVWSIHMRETTPDLGEGSTGTGPGPSLGTDPNSNSNEAFDLMWGKKFGTMSLGLRFNKSFSQLEGNLADFFGPGAGAATNLEFDPSAFDPNLGRNIVGFGGGIGFDMNEKTSAEIGLQWQSRTWELKDSVGTVNGANDHEDNPTAMLLAARLFWQWQPNVMVVPVFKYYTFDLSSVRVDPGTGSTESFDNSLRGWQAGLAGNWTLGTNDLFVLGTTFAQNKAEEEEPTLIFGPTSSSEATESIMPQIFAALETHVNNWLTLRFGANKGVFYSVKVDDRINNKQVELHGSPFSMNLGAGVKVGTLMLDAVVNSDFPHNMPYLISGSSTSPLFTKVTATYAF